MKRFFLSEKKEAENGSVFCLFVHCFYFVAEAFVLPLLRQRISQASSFWSTCACADVPAAISVIPSGSVKDMFDLRAEKTEERSYPC